MSAQKKYRHYKPEINSEKKEIELLIKKIQQKLERDPKSAEKAAQIISQMINKK